MFATGDGFLPPPPRQVLAGEGLAPLWWHLDGFGALVGAAGGACDGDLLFTCGCRMSSWDPRRAFCLAVLALHSLGVSGVFPVVCGGSARKRDQLSKDLYISSLFKECFSTLESSKDDSIRAGF